MRVFFVVSLAVLVAVELFFGGAWAVGGEWGRYGVELGRTTFP